MEIYAKGKNIPTYAFGNLFTEGESYADTITFYVDRYYNSLDMLGFSFSVKGVNESGYEAVQTILPRDCGEYVAIDWNVSSYFTVRAGKLMLELRASKAGETESVVVKYVMPPVNVNPSLNGTNEVIPDTSEQILSEISDAVSEGLAEIRSEVEAFDLTAVEARLDTMDENIAVFLARPEVIPMTKSEYDSSVHKENSLYVILKEDE